MEAAAAAARPRPPPDPAAIMLALISRLLDWFRSLFWKEEMELTLVGLQYSGKTTFVNVIAVRTAAQPRGCGRDRGPRGGLGAWGATGPWGGGGGGRARTSPTARVWSFPRVGGRGVALRSAAGGRCPRRRLLPGAVPSARPGRREGDGARRVPEAPGGWGSSGFALGAAGGLVNSGRDFPEGWGLARPSVL